MFANQLLAAAIPCVCCNQALAAPAPGSCGAAGSASLPPAGSGLRAWQSGERCKDGAGNAASREKGGGSTAMPLALSEPFPRGGWGAEGWLEAPDLSTEEPMADGS